MSNDPLFVLFFFEKIIKSKVPFCLLSTGTTDSKSNLTLSVVAFEPFSDVQSATSPTFSKTIPFLVLANITPQIQQIFPRQVQFL